MASTPYQDPTLRFLLEKLGSCIGSVTVVGTEDRGVGMEYAIGASTLTTVSVLREPEGEGLGGMAKLVVAMALVKAGVCRKMALLSFTSCVFRLALSTSASIWRTSVCFFLRRALQHWAHVQRIMMMMRR